MRNIQPYTAKPVTARSIRNVVLVLAAPLAFAAASSTCAAELLVSAAASLTNAFRDIASISEQEAQSLLEKHRRYLTLRPLIESLESAERRLREAGRTSEMIQSELGQGSGGDRAIRAKGATHPTIG